VLRSDAGTILVRKPVIKVLGGGMVIVPVLTLIFHVDIRYAIGASLVSVIATSSGAAAAYLREGYSNIRIGMFLQIATCLGALLGAYLTARVSTSAIGYVFGVVLLYLASSSRRGAPETSPVSSPDPLGERLRLAGSYRGPDGDIGYTASHVPAGFSLMFLAGALSGLLGVLAGSIIGSRILMKADVGKVRLLFMIVIIALGLEMLFSATTGRLLSTGVAMAALLVLAGGLLYLHEAHGPMQNYSHFNQMSETLRNPTGITRGALRLDSRSIIQLGLLVLIATPVAWVVFAVSTLVLTILLCSLVFGR